jgi:hypothetical protein
MTKELVIAAYDNYIDWLKWSIDEDVKITVYRKGDYVKQREDEIFLSPNLGRDVHSFFYHIYDRYDTLSDITYFAQDYPFDHWEDVIKVVNRGTQDSRCQLQIGGYYGFHYNTITEHSSRGGRMWALSPSKHHGKGNVLVCNSNGSPQDSNPLINVDKYWSRFFKQVPPPAEYEFMPGGHFAITKEHARLRSKEFYKDVADFLQEEEVAPWIVERLECYIFNPNIK